MNWNDSFLNVWVIDDQIPQESIDGIEIDDLDLPIYADGLKQLVNKDEEWEDKRVRELVNEALQNKLMSITAFKHPTHAIIALEKGITPPNLIIYDWEYINSSDASHHEWISKLLKRGFIFLQVYSHKPMESIQIVLDELGTGLSTQILGVSSKDITAEPLIQIIQSRVQSTLAGEVSHHLRRITEEAIGTTLRHFSRIPKELFQKIVPRDSLELLSNLFERQIIDSGLEIDHSLAGALAYPLARTVGELTRASDGLHDSLRSMEETATTAQTTVNEDTNITRLLQSYQIYVKHTTDRVLTGDISILDDDTLILVLTTPCNLDKFSGKTRNTLTFFRIYKCDQDGWETVITGQPQVPGNGKIKIANSFSQPSQYGKDGVFLLPSVPYGKDGIEYEDFFFFFPERIEYRTLDKTECGYEYDDPLKYSQLANMFPKVERLAKISDHYLGPLFWSLAQALFSPGTNDFIKLEHARLKELALRRFQ